MMGGITAPGESALAMLCAELSRELAPTSLCRQVQVFMDLEFIFPEIRHKYLAFARVRPVHFCWQHIPSWAAAGRGQAVPLWRRHRSWEADDKSFEMESFHFGVGK